MQSWWIFLRPILLEEAQRATAYNGETAADTAANILEGTEHCCRVQLFRQSLGKATATAAVAASSNQEVLREALKTPMYSWKCSYFQGACRSFGPLARKTFGPNVGRTGKLLLIYDLIYGKSFARTRRLPTVRRMLVLFGSNFRPSTVDGRTDRNGKTGQTSDSQFWDRVCTYMLWKMGNECNYITWNFGHHGETNAVR